jgi:large subunit ribosomal protein L11
MAKKVKAKIKVQIMGGEATPAPPLGPALGQHGINIAQFCQKFNQATQKMKGELIPVEITIYEDRTFDFVLKTPPVSFLLKKAAGIEKGSDQPNKKKVGKVTREQIREIAIKKLPDLNTKDVEKAMKIVEGTARQMGIEVVD